MIGEILILLALVAGNGLFAGAEIAVLTVRRSRVRELAEGGGGGARALLALRDQPERFLATVQVGITLIGATSAVFGGEFIADPLADSLERAGAGRYAEEIAFVLVVALVTYLSLVIGELVPKSLALRHAERYDALRELQARKTQLAIVTGVDGAVIGLVTIEDLVEELVGEILSEHEPIPIRREPDGTALVRGMVPIREVNRELSMGLPEGAAWTTVAGIVIARAGHVPRQGVVVTLDDGTAIEVVEATPQRFLLVRVRPAARPTSITDTTRGRR